MLNTKRMLKKKNSILYSIGVLLLLIGIFIVIYIIGFNYISNKKDKEIIETYINNYDQIINTSQDVKKNVSLKSNRLNYIAVLEIPKIKLRKGIVMATKNFKSINYAISADQTSTFPDVEGRLILYAHSGTSKISYFKNLNRLNINDNVILFYKGKSYPYKVNNIKEIEKTGKLKISNSISSKELILVTCVHNTNKQLIITCEINERK